MSTRARPAPPPAPHRRPSAGRPAPLLGTLAKKTFPSPPLLPSVPPVAPFLPRSRSCLPAMLAAKRQDGGLFKGPPYPGYPFIMIPDLSSPYLPNGSLSPTARTVSAFFFPPSFLSPPTAPCPAPAAAALPVPRSPRPCRRPLPRAANFPNSAGRGGRGIVYTSPYYFFFFPRLFLILSFSYFLLISFLLSVLWAGFFFEPL